MLMPKGQYPARGALRGFAPQAIANARASPSSVTGAGRFSAAAALDLPQSFRAAGTGLVVGLVTFERVLQFGLEDLG
jgi:hypothetical protein